MTSKIYSAILAGTAVLAVTMGSTSAHAATATADARARVLSALTLTNTADLEFGAIVSGAAGTVVVPPAGLRTCGALSCSGAYNAAAFDITTGTPTEIVDLSSDASVTLIGPTTNMTATLQLSSATVTIGAGGGASFTVGGTLSVGAAQEQGVYTGSFDVTANYQ